MGWGRKNNEPDANDPRALLDQLMGSTRNLTEVEKAVSKPAWETQDCCPLQLAGLCPSNLFSTSSKRSDLPPCEHAVHSTAIQADFRLANPPLLAIYEDRLFSKLKTLVKMMDERVQKAKDRVKLEAVSETNDKAAAALLDLQAKISSLVTQAEAAGDEGHVETAQKALAEVEELTKQRKVLETQVEDNKATVRITGTMYGAQEVCDVCCSITNAAEHQRQQQRDVPDAHKEGQMHIGWGQIRDELARLQKKRDVGSSRSVGFGGGWTASVAAGAVAG
eukprot:CAMPEP_0197607492 /NCGR_PEP_ID=MMETSP1326-20131121/47212_1 /TAXON_ID=1155430 /ORGANISM="Genus nov. species nov., Strain RCC2288" /LENGTH=277 /DNA_ID=CAMNT_0043175561 /DNA_START=50 /DNA_END=879 /DNA_ORIENTATION=-